MTKNYKGKGEGDYRKIDCQLTANGGGGESMRILQNLMGD